LSYGESAGDPWYRARGLIGLSACLRANKRVEAAVRAAATAPRIMRRSGHRVEIAEATLQLAQARAAFGDPNRALTHARRAAEIAEECGHGAITRTAGRILARLESAG